MNKKCVLSLLKLKNKKFAFTVVELLVVIVIIGILATIATLSYTGVMLKAKEATLKMDLENAAAILETDKNFSAMRSYPLNISNANGGKGLISSSGNTFNYSYDSGTKSYTLIASNGDLSYYITSASHAPIPLASFVSVWGGSNRDYSNSIVWTSDGGYVIAGETDGYGAGGFDMFIAKYAFDGTLSWNKTWGGSADESGTSVVQAKDGGFAVTGKTSSYGAGSEDMFIVKYSSDGTLIWNKTWGGTYSDCGNSITQISDGGYVVTGKTGNFGAGDDDVFIVKYNSDGTFSWNKTWGGNKGDFAYSVTKTSDGGFAIAGYTFSYGAGYYDMFIAKYTSDGVLNWSKTWGGSDWDYGNSIVQTSDGGFAVAGYTMSYGAGGGDAFIVKYTSNGTLEWNKTWGGYGYDFGASVVKASDGGYVIAGDTSSYGVGSGDMFIVKFASDGTLNWNKTWGGYYGDYGNSIIQTGDGGYAVTGYTVSYGVGLGDVLIVKYLADGTITKCPSSMCKSPSATVNSPSATVAAPSATTTTPSATTTSPTATITTPSASVAIVVAP